MVRLLSLLCIAMLSLTLAGCNDSAWNQKVTVVVDTPQGEQVGSSVMHVEWNGGIPFFAGDMRGARYKLTGEAPVVDLGGGRYLFSLLKGNDDLARQAIAGARDPMSEAGPKIRHNKGAVVIPPKLYPMLVTFTDPNDPKTVRRVDPENLTATFGAGYALKAITLEIIDTPVTMGAIDKLLSWLGPYPEPKLGPATGGTTNIPFYRLVAHGDFIRR